MPPFTVLHICMGNICRSPMAERLLAMTVEQSVGDVDTAVLLSHSAGTGGWHEGEPMNPPAARQVRAHGADPDGFTARKLKAEHIDAADLVLTATADQSQYVNVLRPDAADRTFVLGEFGRLLRGLDPGRLPVAGRTARQVYARGVALVAAVAAMRGTAGPERGDDLDDPWGRGDRVFAQVADEILATLRPFTATLLG